MLSIDPKANLPVACTGVLSSLRLPVVLSSLIEPFFDICTGNESPLFLPGSFVTLGMLFKSSATIVSKLVDASLFDRLKALIAKVGPQSRTVDLLASICFVEGKPNFANQEMCVRRLWMNVPDRYAVFATFHEVRDPRLPAPLAGAPNGLVLDKRKAPRAYLGREEGPASPVCVAWTGSGAYGPNCSKLWWDCTSLSIDVVGRLETGDASVGTLDLAAVESLFYVLEPAALQERVTGAPFVAPDDSKSKKKKRLQSAAEREQEKTKLAVFGRHQQFALYVLSEVG